MLGISLQGFGTFLTLAVLLLGLGLAAHAVWTVRIARSVWASDRPLPQRGLMIACAAATPVIGFYTWTALRWLRRQGWTSTDASPLRIAPIAAALLAILAAAMLADLQYAPPYRSWANVVGFLPGFGAWYAAMQLVLYMAAQVCGLSRNGFWATRTHLVSAGVLLGSMAAMRL